MFSQPRTHIATTKSLQSTSKVLPGRAMAPARFELVSRMVTVTTRAASFSSRTQPQPPNNKCWPMHFNTWIQWFHWAKKCCINPVCSSLLAFKFTTFHKLCQTKNLIWGQPPMSWAIINKYGIFCKHSAYFWDICRNKKRPNLPKNYKKGALLKSIFVNPIRDSFFQFFAT